MMLSKNESKEVKTMSADCKFCTEEKESCQTGIRNSDFKIEIWKNDSQDLDEEFYLNVQHLNQNIYEEDFKIAYCPICGRKLAWERGKDKKTRILTLMTGCWVFVDGLLLLLLTIYALHLLRYTRQIPTVWLRVVSLLRVPLNLPSATL